LVTFSLNLETDESVFVIFRWLFKNVAVSLAAFHFFTAPSKDIPESETLRI
jgi:hypothetical protein